jgi:hypothetical protein
MTNRTSKECLSDAIDGFSRSALSQIKSHCESHLVIAIKYADDNAALEQEPAFVELKKLLQACNAILAMG